MILLSDGDKDACKTFLNICKKEIKKGNCILIKDRYININGKRTKQVEAIYQLGIFNIKKVWDFILELEVDDCFRVSFERDKKYDFNSEMFEFHKYLNNKRVYIKLTLRNKIVCLSFHEG